MLVKALRKNYEQNVTNICAAYVNHMLTVRTLIFNLVI